MPFVPRMMAVTDASERQHRWNLNETIAEKSLKLAETHRVLKGMIL
jgi:hypothetical protein